MDRGNLPPTLGASLFLRRGKTRINLAKGYRHLPFGCTIVANEAINKERAKEMSTPTAIEQRFRRAPKAEILQLPNHQHLTHISREAVEAVGKDSDLSSGEATYEFLRLKGVVWEGTTSRANDSEHPWDVAQIDVSWFQRRGDTPSP